MTPYRCRIPELIVAAALLGGCSDSEESGFDSIPYDRLSLYGFFQGNPAELRPADRVYPYEVASELWADHSQKLRFVYLPPGTSAVPDAGEGWSFPVGAIVIKSFSFAHDLRDPEAGRRHIETRLLIRDERGWTGHVYLWNAEQTEAVRFVGGKRVPVSYLDELGESRAHEYVVPNTNQCGSCHARDDHMELLGVIGQQLARQVERDGALVDQLGWLAQAGAFGEQGPPSVSEPFASPHGDAPVENRARAWLHANCAHCHRPGGNGGSSGLVLLAWETEPLKLGVCKTPAAAGSGTGGHEHDIVPGQPDDSILPFRIASTDPEIKMPELPNRIVDEQGLEIVKAWIAAMMPAGCP